MIKQALVVASALTLFGCSSDPVEPPLPEPVRPYTFSWKVIPKTDRVYVCLRYEESLRLKVMMEDMTRYMRESNSVMCFYRKDLDEVRCQQAEDDAK